MSRKGEDIGSVYSALDNAKTGKIHYKIAALSAAGTLLDGYDISIIAVALLLLYNIPAFGLVTPLAKALIAASTLIGMIFGGIVFGYITDLKGRKTMYMFDMAIFIVMTIIISLSFNFASLFISRLILGVALGADYAISPAIIAEFTPVKSRGKLLVTNVLFWSVGAAVAVFTGYALLPLGSVAWRYMFILGVIPAAVVFYLRKDIPESARWLVKSGDIERAQEVERSVTGKHDSLKDLLPRKSSIKELFSKKYLKSTIFVAVFWFCMDVTYYGIAIFSPTILSILGLTSQLAVLGAGVFDVFSIIGGIIALLVIDRLGRRLITIIGFTGTTASLVILGIVTYFVPKFSIDAAIAPIIFGTFLVFELIQNVGPGTTDFVYPIELFPTSERATAQGFGTSVSRVGAVLGITTFPFIVLSFGISGSLFFFGAFALIGLLVTILLAPETGGKSLEASSEPDIIISAISRMDEQVSAEVGVEE